MRWNALLVLTLLAPTDEAADKDKAALQGFWTVVAAEQDGSPLDRIKGNTLRIDGDKFTIKTKISDLIGTLELHPGLTPKGIDLTHTEGVVEGSTWYAIYSLEGDCLKLCYADPNADRQRPSDFSTKPNSRLLLVTLKREK